MRADVYLSRQYQCVPAPPVRDDLLRKKLKLDNRPASKYSRAIAPKHPGRARPGNRGNSLPVNEDVKTRVFP
jgi:hypothetical protein